MWSFQRLIEHSVWNLLIYSTSDQWQRIELEQFGVHGVTAVSLTCHEIPVSCMLSSTQFFCVQNCGRIVTYKFNILYAELTHKCRSTFRPNLFSRLTCRILIAAQFSSMTIRKPTKGTSVTVALNHHRNQHSDGNPPPYAKQICLLIRSL